MVDFRPLLFINALALMLLVTAGFAAMQDRNGPATSGPGGSVARDAKPDSNGTLATNDASDKPDSKTETTPVWSASNDAGSGDNKDEVSEPEANANETLFADTANDNDPSTIGSRSTGQSDDVTVDSQAVAADTDNTPTPSSGRGAETPDSAAQASTNPDPTKTVAMAEAAIETGQPKSQSAAEPEPTTAQLTLRSNVVGDSVRINGKPYGATRLDLELEPGDYDISISKQGFRDWQQTVRLAAGDDRTLRGELKAYTRVDYQNGRWIGGVKTGDGSYTGEDGLRYTGHFVDGEFDGEGTAVYPNGDRYEGRWNEDEPAEGTLRMADGSVYEGAFDNGNYNGQGTLTRANGDVLTGEWSGGKLNGRGSLTTEAGKLYVGGFRNGNFHGEGTLTFPDGHTYEGSFSNGEFHGKGSEVFADGKKYVGQYVEGDFHGKGVLMNPNGSSIEATFRYGEPYGQATLTTPEGEVFNARSSEPGVCYRDKSYRATQCPPLEGW